MRGHIRRRGKSYEVIVDTGKDPVSGKRRQMSRSAKTRKDADALLLRLLVELGHGHKIGTDRPFGDLLDAWLEQGRKEWSPSTQNGHRIMVTAIKSALGQMPLSQLTAEFIDRYYDRLLERGLDPASVRRFHVCIRGSLKLGVRWRWIPSNPAVDASPPTVRRRKVPAPPPELVKLMTLAAAENAPELVAFLRLDGATGARRGEVCALRWRHVDLEARTVHFERAIVDGGPGVGIVDKTVPKTERSNRIVTIDDDTAQVLRVHRARMAERALAAGVSLPPEGYVFSLTPDCSRPWRPDYPTHRVTRLRELVGAALALSHWATGERFVVPAVTINDLRHFVATRMIDGGIPVPTVSKLLGHSRTSTTLDMYTDAVDARDEQAAEVMRRLLG